MQHTGKKKSKFRQYGVCISLDYSIVFIFSVDRIRTTSYASFALHFPVVLWLPGATEPDKGRQTDRQKKKTCESSPQHKERVLDELTLLPIVCFLSSSLPGARINKPLERRDVEIN